MAQVGERKVEVAAKLARLRERMVAREIDAVHLRTIPNTGWITAGGSLYVGEGTDSAASAIVVTQDRAIALTDSIETPRLRQEEHLADLGFEFVTEPWYTRGAWLRLLQERVRVGSDSLDGAVVNMEPDLQDLRTHLQAEEVTRLREIGVLAVAAMDAAIRGVTPGMTEYEVAGRLAAACRARGGTGIVNLVASDERIADYRHPLPTDKPIDKYVMLVLSMRRQGLVAALTRLIHFGALPSVLRDKSRAVAEVDAKLILGTRPGCTMSEMFALARQAYRDAGYPEAIEQHHQGGSIAYKSREILAQPDNDTVIARQQAFAWNPSIRGVKSEDTMLVGPDGPEVVTKTAGWPTWEITVADQVLTRPAILEV